MDHCLKQGSIESPSGGWRARQKLCKEGVGVDLLPLPKVAQQYLHGFHQPTAGPADLAAQRLRLLYIAVHLCCNLGNAAEPAVPSSILFSQPHDLHLPFPSSCLISAKGFLVRLSRFGGSVYCRHSSCGLHHAVFLYFLVVNLYLNLRHSLTASRLLMDRMQTCKLRTCFVRPV